MITTPIIIGIIGNTKKKAFQASLNGIYEAVKLDVAADTFLVPRIYYYDYGTLTLQTVEESSRNEEIALNGKIEGNGYITVDVDGDIIIEEICDDNYCGYNTKEDQKIIVTENNGSQKSDRPVIVLNGEATIELGIGETYKELGAVAKTADGKQELSYSKKITKDGIEVENIDTTKPGIYIVIYQASNADQNVEERRTVNVVDKKGPVITITGPELIYSPTYAADETKLTREKLLQGVKVVDDVDGEMSLDKVEIGGTVSGINAVQEVTYTVTDSSGNKGTARRTINTCYSFDASTGEITNYGNNNTCTKEVVIPTIIDDTSVTGIGNYAFDAKGLTSVEIPEGITKIGVASLQYNQLLTISIPTSVETIDGYAFLANQLTNITFLPPSKLTSIKVGAFERNQLTSITIPDTVTYIEGESFNDNQLPDDQAFIYARNSDGTKKLTNLVSYGGAKRDNVVIPSHITTIENAAFAANQITSITIPESVTSIGNYAFQGNRLTNIDIPKSVVKFGYGTFNHNELPDDQAFIYGRDNNGNEVTTWLISYGGARKENVKIPDTVTSIEDWSFRTTELKSVILSENLIHIGHYAFYNNQLTNVTIPEKVSSIGINAFYVNKLTQITIPSSVKRLGDDAFARNQLTSVNIKGKNSSSEFDNYGKNIFGWAEGYSDDNIRWNG